MEISWTSVAISTGETAAYSCVEGTQKMSDTGWIQGCREGFERPLHIHRSYAAQILQGTPTSTVSFQAFVFMNNIDQIVSILTFTRYNREGPNNPMFLPSAWKVLFPSFDIECVYK